MNKILNLVLILFMVGMSAYPVPVSCQHFPHSPTLSTSAISQQYGHLGHVGADYNVAVGTNVYTVMDGIVIRTMEDSNVYGRFAMVLQCDGYLSLYAHLSKFTVKFGDIVNSGQIIATSGGDPYDDIDGDGQSSGAHLHWEVRVPGHFDNNLYNIDPLIYLEDANQNMEIRKALK